MSEDSVPQKLCRKCGNVYPATNEYFCNHKGKSGGLDSWCKKCKAEYQRNNRACNTASAKAWRLRYPEKYEAQKQKYCEKKRLERDARNAPRRRPRQQWQTEEEKKRAYYERRDKEKRRQSLRLWRKRHPERRRMHRQKYEAQKRLLPSTFTAKEWVRCLEYWHYTCAYCGKQRDFWATLQQDHYIALSRMGAYVTDNIVPACRECNISKHDNLAEEWLARKKGKRKAAEILAKIEAYFEWVKGQ